MDMLNAQDSCFLNGALFERLGRANQEVAEEEHRGRRAGEIDIPEPFDTRFQPAFNQGPGRVVGFEVMVSADAPDANPAIATV